MVAGTPCFPQHMQMHPAPPVCTLLLPACALLSPEAKHFTCHSLFVLLLLLLPCTEGVPLI